MTQKERAFYHWYIMTWCNGAEAARLAGYSDRNGNARRIAWAILHRPKFVKYQRAWATLMCEGEEEREELVAGGIELQAEFEVMLTERQMAFCRAYVVTGNGTEAARAAGYSDKGSAARVVACRLLKRHKIIGTIAAYHMAMGEP